MTEQKFQPEKHLIELQGKAYLECKWRIAWFRQECPQGIIKTEEVLVDLDRMCEAEVPTGNWIPNPNRPGKKMPEKVIVTKPGYARFKAIIDDGKGGHAEATKTECAASFPDYCEKAETSAIGRALALLGYGTQFTADELNEEHRIADAPVARASVPQYASNGNASQPAASPAPASIPLTEEQKNAPATEQQCAAWRKLCQHLGQPEPDTVGVTYLSAKETILQLSREYNESRQNRKAS